MIIPRPILYAPRLMTSVGTHESHSHYLSVTRMVELFRTSVTRFVVCKDVPVVNGRTIEICLGCRGGTRSEFTVLRKLNSEFQGLGALRTFAGLLEVYSAVDAIDPNMRWSTAKMALLTMCAECLRNRGVPEDLVRQRLDSLEGFPLNVVAVGVYDDFVGNNLYLRPTSQPSSTWPVGVQQ